MDTEFSAKILYEDNHLLIINKACGELAQNDKTGDHSLLDSARDYLKAKYNKPGGVFIGLPHRLDRPSSGIVILARTSKALSRLNEKFRTSNVKKKYLAIVCSPPPRDSDTLENYLYKNEKQNKSYVCDSNKKGAKKAVLSYRLIGSGDKYYCLEIDLHTGRHHQIRCQLAHIGCVIKGDLKYGAVRSNKNGGIDLHAVSVSFTHPVSGKELTVQAPPPDNNLWAVLCSSYAIN